MSALITNVEHALAIAAQDVVKAAKFVETSVLPVLKEAQANQSTIESITSLVSPSAANIERAGFAVLGVVINALDAAGTAAGANGLGFAKWEWISGPTSWQTVTPWHSANGTLGGSSPRLPPGAAAPSLG